MKSQINTALLGILVLTACMPIATTTPAATTPVIPLTQTKTPQPVTSTPRPTTSQNLGPTLQVGNELPRTKISRIETLTELANNRIGDLFPLDRNPIPCPEVSTDWPAAHVRRLGLKWVRLSLDYLELESVRNWDNYSQFEINQCQDEAIAYLAEQDITILYTLVYWDENLHAKNYPDYKNEQDVQLFLDYTRLIVNHFRGRIQYYEILNEAYFYVNVEDYIELIRRVIPIIRMEDPEAKIVVGGTTNLMYDHSQEYLYRLIQSDIISLVDGIAMHPMYGASPQYDDTRQYYEEYPTLIQDIKDTAWSNGFTGEFLAEEMVWRTPINPNIYEPWEYTFEVAAKYYARGIMMNLGLGLWAGIGGEKYDSIPPIVRVVQNLTTIMADAEPANLSVEIESGAENILSYSFSTPSGDRLFALWTNGPAIDEDPGIKATLLFENLSAESVMGIDVFEGLSQEIRTETIEGNLVIQDLVVRDYPIILKFIGATP